MQNIESETQTEREGEREEGRKEGREGGGKRLIGIKHIKMTGVCSGAGCALALMTDKVLLSQPVRRGQL